MRLSQLRVYACSVTRLPALRRVEAAAWFAAIFLLVSKRKPAGLDRAAVRARGVSGALVGAGRIGRRKQRGGGRRQCVPRQLRFSLKLVELEQKAVDRA